MLVLALDTATPVLSVAIAAVDDGCRVIATRDVEAPNRHGELLAPLIDDVLREADATRTDLAAVAVGLGPGPFTGLRVGIVTAAAIADALGIPAYGVSSLDVIAAQHAGSGDAGLLVLTDARRRQVYWARYDGDGRRVDGPEIDLPAVVADRFRADGLQVCGAGALVQRESLDGLPIRTDDPNPRAATLLAMVAGRARTGAPGDRLDPLYLRRPDARPPGAPKPVTPR